MNNCSKCMEWHPIKCLCITCANSCECKDAKIYNNKKECLLYIEKENKQVEIVFKNGSVIKGIHSSQSSIRGTRSKFIW